MASILVIDDDFLVRSFCREILEQAGYKVLLAGNGRQGLQLFHLTPTDLVVTDLFMPEHDGLEIIMTLHQEAPTIPIIAVTGDSEGHLYLNVAKYLGAQRIIAKPFSPLELLQAVQQQLSELS